MRSPFDEIATRVASIPNRADAGMNTPSIETPDAGRPCTKNPSKSCAWGSTALIYVTRQAADCDSPDAKISDGLRPTSGFSSLGSCSNRPTWVKMSKDQASPGCSSSAYRSGASNLRWMPSTNPPPSMPTFWADTPTQAWPAAAT